MIGTDGHKVRQYTGYHDDHTGIQCKLLSDSLKADNCRYGIQDQADRGKWKGNTQKLFKNRLDQTCNSIKASWVQTSRPDKDLNIHCHDHCADQPENNSLCFPLGIYIQIHILLHNFFLEHVGAKFLW